MPHSQPTSSTKRRWGELAVEGPEWTQPEAVRGGDSQRKKVRPARSSLPAPRTASDPGRPPVPSVHDEAQTVKDHQPTVPPQPPTAPARPQPTARQLGRGRLGLTETQDFACAARHLSERSGQNTPPSPAHVQRGLAKPRLLPFRTPPPAAVHTGWGDRGGKIHCHAPLHVRGHAVSYASSPRHRPRSTPPPGVAKVTHAGRQTGGGCGWGVGGRHPRVGVARSCAAQLGHLPSLRQIPWPRAPSHSRCRHGCAARRRRTPAPLRLSRRFFASVFAAAWRAPLHALSPPRRQSTVSRVRMWPQRSCAGGGRGGGGGAQM